MPYIKKERRHEVIPPAARDMMHFENVGELNYTLTKIILDYLYERGECYQTYNDIIGVLSCMIQEIYRRKVAPYEEKKIEENGDVF